MLPGFHWFSRMNRMCYCVSFSRMHSITSQSSWYGSMEKRSARFSAAKIDRYADSCNFSPHRRSSINPSKSRHKDMNLARIFFNFLYFLLNIFYRISIHSHTAPKYLENIVEIFPQNIIEFPKLRTEYDVCNIFEIL